MKLLFNTVLVAVLLLNTAATYPPEPHQFWQDSNYSYEQFTDYTPKNTADSIPHLKARVKNLINTYNSVGIPTEITYESPTEIDFRSHQLGKVNMNMFSDTRIIYSYNKDSLITIKLDQSPRHAPEYASGNDGYTNNSTGAVGSETNTGKMINTLIPPTNGYGYSFKGRNGYTIYNFGNGNYGYSFQGKNGNTIYQKY